MRRAARTDRNHAEIRDKLRKEGLTVVDTSRLGSGFPDLIVADKDKIALVEVKSPDGKLTDDQCKFIARWPQEVIIAFSELDVLREFK